jgi:hypothetical protein
MCMIKFYFVSGSAKEKSFGSGFGSAKAKVSDPQHWYGFQRPWIIGDDG